MVFDGTASEQSCSEVCPHCSTAPAYVDVVDVPEAYITADAKEDAIEDALTPAQKRKLRAHQATEAQAEAAAEEAT